MAENVPAIVLCGGLASHPQPSDFCDVVANFSPDSVRCKYVPEPPPQLGDNTAKWLRGQQLEAGRICATCYNRYQNARKARDRVAFVRLTSGRSIRVP